MNKKILFSFSIIVLLISGFIKDDSLLVQLLEKLNNFTSSYPQEKVHLHLDKPYYAIGEHIWVKGYIVTAEKNEPSALSKVLYIDLIDEENVVKQAIKLPIKDGISSGSILLSDSLAAGNYRIRSYTNYMRNFDSDFFFEKQIVIGDIFNIKNTKETVVSNVVGQLNFFPEGGNLIYGIRSKVGIKAISKDGRGINVSGYIADENNQKIAVFNTEHAGMGALALTPQKGAKYKAYIVDENGKSITFDFPEVVTSGYSLGVNTVSGNDQLSLKIAASEDLLKGQTLHIIGQVNGIVYYSSSIKLSNSLVTASIPKKLFPTGILQFTIITNDQVPVAERLVFINHNDQLKININPEKAQVAIQSKANFDLMVTDQNDNPIDGNFSVSVTDLDKVPFNEDDETTILSNLLLSSDLKGFIEQPNYYFNNINADKERQLDNLLLTQGWTRFVWKELLKDTEPKLTYHVEQSLEITGTITSLQNKPLANVKVVLISTTPGFNFVIDTVSNANGKFVFDRLDFPDTATFLVRAKDDKLANSVKIGINKLPKVRPATYLGNSININSYLESTKKLYNEQTKYNVVDGSIRLREVRISAQKVMQKPKVSAYSNNPNGRYDHLITKDKLKTVTNLFDAFYNMPGVNVMGKNIVRSSVRAVSIMNKEGKPSPMAIFLDGMRYGESLDKIFPGDVESIEIITSIQNTVAYGPEGYWGVILITTKRVDEEENIPTTNIAKIQKNGYALVKEFYMPNYDNPKINKEILDLRSTIYWNPNINTAVNGKGNFNFFTASTPGKYRIVVEGMDIYGNLGRKIYTYTVQ